MPANPTHAIRLVAAFEAFKGVMVLLSASGLLLLVHRDLHALAVRLVEHAHLNPAARYPGIFIEAATRMHDVRLTWIALGAVAYALVRFTEAYGLFHNKAWGEVLAAGSGAIYLPFEVAELLRRPGLLEVSMLVVNIAIVALMLWALARRRALRTGT